MDFTNGVARAIIADTTGEVVNLELTDSGQTGLDVTNDAYDLVSPSLPAGVQSIDFRAFPTKYVITSAPDTYIRTATVVRIEARDVNNAMMTTYSGVVTLSATGSATGEGQVTITAGFGTKSLLDNVAETVNLSLSAASDDLDVSNSGGDSTIVFSYKPVAKFKITNAPDTLQTQNTTITIEAQDEDNNRVPDYTLSSAVRLTTSGSATGGGMLNFTAGLATKVITDAVAETVNLGFSNPVNPAINITNTGGDPNVVFGAFPTKYVITSVPDSYVNNATTVTIQAQDALGVKVGLYSGSVTLNVQGPATGGGVVTIIAGQGTIMVNDAVEQLVGLSLSTPSPDALDVSNVSGRQNVRFSYRPLTIVVPALGSSYSNSSILNTLDDSLLADNGTTSDDYVGKYDINSGSAERALIQVIIKNKNVVAQGETGTVDILIIGTDDKVRKAYLGNDAVVDSSNNTVVSDIAIPMYPGEGLLFKNNVVGAGISMGAHADGVRVVGAIDVGDTVPSRTTEAPQAVYDLATPTVTPITATGACDINAPIAVARGPGFYSWEDTLTCTASSYSFNLYLVDHVGSTTLTLTQGGNETIRTFTIARKNYFGSGADGALTVTTLTQLAVSGGANAYDGDMVVKNYTNLTIVNGGELTVASPARGLLIYVSGNLTVNGKISMTGKGALIDPVDAGVLSTGLRFLRMKSGSSETHGGSELDGSGATSILAEARQPESVADGKFYVIARQGSAGGASISADGVGLTGVGSAAGKAGGGGGGATFGGIGGSGSAGTCFSGGSGGGAGYNGVGSDASLYGGEGGLCTANTNSAGGGAGNPGGGLCGAGTAPQSGTGGLLVIIVKGTTVIGATGIIEANGMLGGSADVGGGGSGGGNILILHGGAYTNNGALRVLGGSGGTGGTYSGGTGGAGYSSVDLIDQ